MPPEHDIVASPRTEVDALRARVARLERALQAAIEGETPEAEGPTWRQVFASFATWYAAERRGNSLRTMWTQARALLASPFVDKPIAQLTWGDLDAHKARRRSKLTMRKRPVADATLDLEVCLTLTVINWACKHGRQKETGVKANPIAGYPMRTQRHGNKVDDRGGKGAARRKPYTYSEQERLMAEITHPALRALIMLVANFFRPREVLASERAQWVACSGQWLGWYIVELRGDQTKNGKPRSIPVSPERMAYVMDLPGWRSGATHPFLNPGTGRPYTLNHLEHLFVVARDAAGIVRADGRPADIYAFRMTGATRALAAGVPVTTVAELMGHQDAGQTITKHYNEVDDAARVQAIATLEASRNPPERRPPLRSVPVAEGVLENLHRTVRK